jgi:hypothetical protein
LKEFIGPSPNTRSLLRGIRLIMPMSLGSYFPHAGV